MSRCPNAELLDAAIAEELSVAMRQQVWAHVDRCAACRHEMRWLETEKMLFHARSIRAEYASPRSDSSHWWPLKASMAMALVVMALVGWQRHVTRSDHSMRLAFDESQQSEILESRLGDAPLCSPTDGPVGFHCGPLVAASFVASR